jgi:hypothetical protein
MRVMKYARLSAAAFLVLLAVIFVFPGSAFGATFNNDFTLGQALDVANLGTSVTGAGVAVVSAGKLAIATPATGDSAVCYFRAAVAKGQAGSYAARFAIAGLNDGGSLGVLDLRRDCSQVVWCARA